MLNPGGAPPFPHTPPEAEAPFAWLPAAIAFLRRNLWLFALTGALGLIAALGYVMVVPQRFTAAAELLIDTRRAHPVRPQPVNLDAQSENAFVESQVEVLRSTGTLRLVVERLNLAGDPMFSLRDSGGGMIQKLRRSLGLAEAEEPVEAGLRAQEVAVRELAKLLRVTRSGLTSVISVSITSKGRDLSARLANAIVDVYVEQQLNGNADTNRRAGTWLQERLAELRGEALRSDQAVQEFKAANDMVDLGSGNMLGEAEINESAQLVAAARVRFSEAQARAAAVERVTPGAVLQGSVVEALQNPVIIRLRQQFLEASRREAEVATRLGRTHGVAVSLRAEMGELENAIQNELRRIAEANTNELRVAAANLRTVEEQVRGQVARVTAQNLQRSSLRSLQSAADAYRGIFESFLQRYTQAMQDQSYPISDARLLSRAVPPFEKSQPRASLLLAVGVAAGLALGFALAILRETLDRRIRTPAGLARAAGVARSWAVPEDARLRLPARWSWTAALAEGPALHLPDALVGGALDLASPAAPALRGLRAALARAEATGAPLRCVAVAGFNAGTGATAVAASLGAAAALEGRRVILAVILPERFGDARDLRSGMRVVAYPDAGALFAALPQLRAEADLVVVELPPVRGGSLLLGPGLDALVPVARWGFTTEAAVAEAMVRADAADLCLPGAVLTRCHPRRMRLYTAGEAAPRLHETPVA